MAAAVPAEVTCAECRKNFDATDAEAGALDTTDGNWYCHECGMAAGYRRCIQCDGWTLPKAVNKTGVNVCDRHVPDTTADSPPTTPIFFLAVATQMALTSCTPASRDTLQRQILLLLDEAKLKVAVINQFATNQGGIAAETTRIEDGDAPRLETSAGRSTSSAAAVLPDDLREVTTTTTAASAAASCGEFDTSDGAVAAFLDRLRSQPTLQTLSFEMIFKSPPDAPEQRVDITVQRTDPKLNLRLTLGRATWLFVDVDQQAKVILYTGTPYTTPPTVVTVTRAIEQAISAVVVPPTIHRVPIASEQPDPAETGLNGGYRSGAHTLEGAPANPRIEQNEMRTVTLIHGETGSGKTSYATRGIQSALRCDVTLYVNVAATATTYTDVATALSAVEKADRDILNDPKYRALLPGAGALYAQLDRLRQRCRSNADAQHIFDARKVIRSVMEPYYQQRDECAVLAAIQLLKKAVDKTPRLQSWFEAAEREPVKRLAFVIDEIGSYLELARGIASAQQEIYRRTKPYADRLELVLVGTGADEMLYGADRPSTDPGLVSRVKILPPRHGNGLAWLKSMVTSGLDPTETDKLERLLDRRQDSIMEALLANARLTVLLSRNIRQSKEDIDGQLPMLIRDALRDFPDTSGLKPLNAARRRELIDAVYAVLMGPDGSEDAAGWFGVPCPAAATVRECLQFGLLVRGATDDKCLDASSAMKLLAISDFGRLVYHGDRYRLERGLNITVMLQRHLSFLGYAVSAVNLLYPLPSGSGKSGLTAGDYHAIVGAFSGPARREAVVITNGPSAWGADFVVLRRDPTSSAGSVASLRCDFIGCNRNRSDAAGGGYTNHFRTLGISTEVTLRRSMSLWTLRPNGTTYPYSNQQGIVIAFQELLHGVDGALRRGAPPTSISKIVKQKNLSAFEGKRRSDVTTNFVLIETSTARTRLGTKRGGVHTHTGERFEVMECNDLRLWKDFLQQVPRCEMWKHSPPPKATF